MRQLIKILLIIVIIASCSTKKDKQKKYTSISEGTIYIAVEHAFKPVMEAEIEMYQSKYPKTKIIAEYLPESKAVERFLDPQDSIILIVIPRKLAPQEKEIIKKANLSPKETHIAYDAIAIIVNPTNMLRKFTTQQIKQILEGKINTWKDLKGSNLEDSLITVVDDPGSSTIKYLIDSLKIDSLAKNKIYATGSIEKVIDYVAENEPAIGFVPLNWISDRDDSTANKFLSKISVCRISNDGENFYEPFQYHILTKKYPFIRNVYCIHKEHYTGLASGFTAFVAGPIGQKIILLQDLLPARAPIRIVEFKEGNYLKENEN